MSEPLAHSGGHLLVDHLRAVAALAAEFSQPFDASDPTQRWAYLAGLWHDLGKYRPGFQKYVRLADNPDAHIEGKVGGREKTHSVAGALWALQRLEQAHGAPGKLASRVLAYLIAGHHSGLADWDDGLEQRLADPDSLQELQESLFANPPDDVLTPDGFIPDLRRISGGAAGFALWVRMLCSCASQTDLAPVSCSS